MLTAFVLGFLGLPCVSAHPGTGLVEMPDGAIVYTDLENVWRVDREGRVGLLVQGVHSHLLGLDDDGRLMGEDAEYLGDDRFRTRVWKLEDHTIRAIIPWSEGGWLRFGFVRDREGGRYWAECPERRCTLYRRDRDGRTTVVEPPSTFRTTPINSVAVTDDGAIWWVDGEEIRRRERNGQVATIASSAGRGLMGLRAVGYDIIVAAHWDRSVLRIRPNGSRRVIVRSEPRWMPVSALYARDGSLWILESNRRNEVRARRIEQGGRVTTFVRPRAENVSNELPPERASSGRW